MKEELHVCYFWELTESVEHIKCLVKWLIVWTESKFKKWVIIMRTNLIFLLMLNSAGRKSHANDCHSVRYKTNMHKRWYIFIIILLMAEMKIMWLHRTDFFIIIILLLNLNRKCLCTGLNRTYLVQIHKPGITASSQGTKC